MQNGNLLTSTSAVAGILSYGFIGTAYDWAIAPGPEAAIQISSMAFCNTSTSTVTVTITMCFMGDAPSDTKAIVHKFPIPAKVTYTPYQLIGARLGPVDMVYAKASVSGKVTWLSSGIKFS